MRIFAVAHVLDLFPLAGEDLREAGALVVFVKAREVVRDHAVVAGGMGEDLLGEREARRGRDTAFGLDFGDDGGVVGRINDHGDGLVVLAAARIIVGPPMSMFSMASSNVQSGLAIVCSNG